MPGGSILSLVTYSAFIYMQEKNSVIKKTVLISETSTAIFYTFTGDGLSQLIFLCYENIFQYKIVFHKIESNITMNNQNSNGTNWHRRQFFSSSCRRPTAGTASSRLRTQILDGIKLVFSPVAGSLAGLSWCCGSCTC